MKAFIKSVPFWLGIISGVALTLIVAIVDYKMKFDDLCFDCDNNFGFPLKVYQSGSLVHATKTLWAGVLGNLVIFSLFSVCLGSIAHSLWSRKVLK